MSFTLKSIELNNIRAHEHFLFEPALEGITAISGDNGAGKSTIVDSFAWCLYGTRPSGIRNKNFIKDGVNPKDKPVSVKAIINVGGIDYAIERKIITAHGATECNVWGRKPGSKKYTQVAGPAVTHVEKFIRSELGMNEKGFLTSVLIQQKQVDQIVSATPRERGVVIEELTGIASITQAIQKTNENTRSLEKAASIFKVGNVDEATERVNKQKETCKKITRREEDAISKFNEMKKYYGEIKNDLEIQTVKVNKRIKLTQEIDSYKKQVAFLKKQAEDDLEYIKNFKTEYGTTIVKDIKELKVKVDNCRKNLYEIKSLLDNVKSEVENIDGELNKCKVLKKGFTTQKEAKGELTSLESKLEKAENKLTDKISRKSMLTSEIKHSKASHEHIDGEDKNCPVCKSAIDNPESLKNEIIADIESYKKEMETIDGEIGELKSDIATLKDNIKSVKISIEAIKHETSLKKEKKLANETIRNKEREMSLATSDLEIAEKEYDNALRIEADKKSLESAKKRSLTVNSTIAENENEIKKREEELKELNALSDRSHNALIKRVDEARDRLGRMTVAGKEIRGRKILELERLEDYKGNLKEAEESMEKYNELATQIEVSTSASTMLSTFKADRIEHAIPTLEFFASDFLSKFTGGAFSKLTVDEKFNTFVTTDKGVIRPVAQLSGGELSSTSIALRLGIAMLLNSSEKNVLILDEVLVSMDEDRSRQIMETIGSMTNSQVIFIAHNSDINSIADKTVLVKK